ncbi:MAG: threonine ammonia-lyase [Bacillota bacterium]
MMTLPYSQVGINEIKEAYTALSGVIHHTPLDYSHSLSRLTGNETYLKAENLQKTGSFKIRGAYNKIRLLERSCQQGGIIAASAGNHAQGVALAARLVGASCTVVMPVGAPVSKVVATRGYGATVVLSGDSYHEAYLKAMEMQQELGGTYVHAFNDPAVVAGQGTVAIEVLEDLPDVEAFIVPVGGGGLISGIGALVKSLRPGTLVYGVQAAGAPAMVASRQKGQLEELDQVHTLADGIAVKRPGDLTFQMIEKYVDDLVTVTDEEIATAILMLLERCKMVAEGAGAVGLAALLAHKFPLQNRKVAVIISGGNIDVQVVSNIIERGLVKAGRYVRLRTHLDDKPGELQRLLSLVASTQANVSSITHDRLRPSVPLTRAEVVLTLETKDHQHISLIMNALRQEGYDVDNITS